MESSRTVVLPVNPVPASRPRVSKWGVYYGKTYKQWMKDADENLPVARATLEGEVRCELEFIVQRPKTTKRSNPRGDIDNYIKSILDALTKKGHWKDDDQVVELVATKRYTQGDEQPRTVAKIVPL